MYERTDDGIQSADDRECYCYEIKRHGKCHIELDGGHHAL